MVLLSISRGCHLRDDRRKRQDKSNHRQPYRPLTAGVLDIMCREDTCEIRIVHTMAAIADLDRKEMSPCVRTRFISMLMVQVVIKVSEEQLRLASKLPCYGRYVYGQVRIVLTRTRAGIRRLVHLGYAAEYFTFAREFHCLDCLI